MHIAYLEDDSDQADVVRVWLEGAGHEVTWYDRAAHFQEQVGSRAADLLLLDWELPDGDGLSVLKWLRATRDDDRPAIFLTAREAEKDVVAALDAGADDYLVKPLSRKVTLARIAAVGRRSIQGQVEPDLGELSVDRRHERILRRGDPVALTRREYELAVYLIDRLDTILPRRQLLADLWGLNEHVVTRTLDTHVSRIKRKLGLKPEFGWSLKSIYHHGYRLSRVSGKGEAGG